MSTTELIHDHYGDYDEQPHTAIEMHIGMWEATEQALEFKLGPPIAWEYKGGMLYLWGENLDEDTLRRISDACHEVEADNREMAIYSGATCARKASSVVLRADIER